MNLPQDPFVGVPIGTWTTFSVFFVFEQWFHKSFPNEQPDIKQKLKKAKVWEQNSFCLRISVCPCDTAHLKTIIIKLEFIAKVQGLHLFLWFWSSNYPLDNPEWNAMNHTRQACRSQRVCWRKNCVHTASLALSYSCQALEKPKLFQVQRHPCAHSMQKTTSRMNCFKKARMSSFFFFNDFCLFVFSS